MPMMMIIQLESDGANRWGQLWGRLVPLEILLLQQVCILYSNCHSISIITIVIVIVIMIHKIIMITTINDS